MSNKNKNTEKCDVCLFLSEKHEFTATSVELLNKTAQFKAHTAQETKVGM